MAIAASESFSRNGTDVNAGNAEDAGTDVNAGNAEDAATVSLELGPRDLPLRQVSYRQPARRIRCMDDPEILRRVLEGLVGLI
jgi:hypothetical protein